MSQEFHLNPDYQVTTEAQLRGLFPATHDLAVTKCQNRLGRHDQAFIARAPFLCIGTFAPDGRADVSPRGDPPGFVKVLDARTLLIPDRPGNNRLDTQANILANPSVGLLFLIPGLDETLRVNGRARISRDPALLALTRVKDRISTTVIVLSVDEVFLHCAKAFRRSGLWDPAQRQTRGDLPPLMTYILDQTTGAPDSAEAQARLEAELEADYRTSMY